MIVEVLVCRPDGTQELVQKEVPEDYFSVSDEMPEEKQTEE